MDGMAAQTRVVLSTAGPFALIGSPVVAAAVRAGCHYVDITGGWRGGMMHCLNLTSSLEQLGWFVQAEPALCCRSVQCSSQPAAGHGRPLNSIAALPAPLCHQARRPG